MLRVAAAATIYSEDNDEAATAPPVPRSGGQTERHMYDFYFRATGLDEVMAQLHAIEEDTKLIRCGLKSASDRLEKLEEEMAEVDDMRSALEHSSLLQGLQESLLNLIPWSKVLTARRRIAEVEESLSTTPALLADLRDKRDAAAKQVEGLADEVKQMERRVEELLGDIEKCAEKDKEAREVIAAEKKRLNAKETEIRDLRGEWRG